MDVSARPDPETEPPEFEPPEAEPSVTSDPQAAAAADWPDRSHWSEFDLAIEAGRTGESPEAEQPSEADDGSRSES